MSNRRRHRSPHAAVGRPTRFLLAPAARSPAAMASVIENEEAIIRKRYLTQTVATAANTMPPFKQLVKK